MLSIVTAVIIQEINPSFAKLRDFLETEYLPETRDKIGVTSLPGGIEFYQACLKWHLSIHATPQEVHQTGLEEVTRLQERMQDIMDQKPQIAAKKVIDVLIKWARKNFLSESKPKEEPKLKEKEADEEPKKDEEKTESKEQEVKEPYQEKEKSDARKLFLAGDS